MRINLDTEKKRALIKALQQGWLESSIVTDWSRNAPPQTDEDMWNEYYRIEKAMYPENCKVMKKMGLCHERNGCKDYPKFEPWKWTPDWKGYNGLDD